MQINQQNVEAEAQVLKAQGNDAFKAGNWPDAISLYKKALIISSNDVEKSILLSNRAAARLKLQQYAEALHDSNEALDYNPKLVKALFRKALALEGLGEIASALVAAREALLKEPSNTALFDLTARLAPLCSFSKPQKTELARNMLPKLFSKAPFQQIPSVDGVDENLLLLFHGLGDTPAPFASLAKTLALPQTSCIALGAPHEVPLSDGGRSWFTVLDPTTFELIPGKKGEIRRVQSMQKTVDALYQLLLHLNVYCGRSDSRKIHLFGFSQGGTVGMELVRRCAAQGKALGSCVAIASGLLDEQLFEQPVANETKGNSIYKIPVLLLHGDQDSVVSRPRVRGTEVLLKSEGMEVEMHSISGQRHTMLNTEIETRIVMEFWSRHLSNRPVDDNLSSDVGVGGEQEASSSLIELAPGVASISLA